MDPWASAAATPPRSSAARSCRRQQARHQPAHAATSPPPLSHQQHAPSILLEQQQQRRQVLTGLLGLAAAGLLPSRAAPASEGAPSLLEPGSDAIVGAAKARPGSIAARIATGGSIQQPGIMPPWAPKQIYFPRWLFGEWEVDMEFTALQLPLGRKYVPSGYLQAADAPAEEGGLGSRYRFRQRFYSTLPDTLENNLRVNLGLGMPQGAVIADRAFNTRAYTNALLGYGAVESVEYDPRDAPLRETATLSRLAPDMAPLPPRRLELYLNSLQSEAGDGDAFFTSELCRQVLLGVRQVEVSDYEIMHGYRQLGPGRVEGRQRSCLYLQPQEQLFFEAGGRAVAVYDYTFSMRRLPPEADAPARAEACVQTPKQVFQCI